MLKKTISHIYFATLLIAATSANAAWTIKDLGIFDGTNSASSAINNSGQIIGIVGCCGGALGHSFITGPNGTGSTYIGDYQTWANGINDLGQVAGNDHGLPFFTGPDGAGIMQIGIKLGEARDINNAGQVVGNVYFDGFGTPHAFMTAPGGAGITDLGTLSSNYSDARSINDQGQVTGFYYTKDNLSRAFITDNNGAGIRDLGTLGGDQSFGSKINESGQVAGWSTLTSIESTDISFRHAFITGPNGAGMTDIGVMGGDFSEVRGLNNLGEAVGLAGFGPTCFCNPDSFLFSHGMMINLTRLDTVQSAGWSTIYPMDINDHGQITGWGVIGGVEHAFLLSGADEEFFRTYVPVPVPIPEPQTYAMLLAGLGLMGFMGRKQAKK